MESSTLTSYAPVWWYQALSFLLNIGLWIFTLVLGVLIARVRTPRATTVRAVAGFLLPYALTFMCFQLVSLADVVSITPAIVHVGLGLLLPSFFMEAGRHVITKGSSLERALLNFVTGTLSLLLWSALWVLKGHWDVAYFGAACLVGFLVHLIVRGTPPWFDKMKAFIIECRK